MWWLNMKLHKSIKNGFTLLEMLLVLVIVSSLIAMFLNFTTKQFHQQQRDKTVVQMQQILNAALAYYVNYGSWPGGTDKSCTSSGDVLNATHPLLVNNYLPNATWTNAYAKSFLTCVDTSTSGTNVFYVIDEINSANTATDAKIIAGMLPFGLTTTASSGGGGGGSSVPMPTFPFTQTTCPAAGGGGGGSSASCMVVSGVNPPGQSLNTARSVNFGSIYSSGQCVPYPACPAGMTPQIYAVPVSVNGAFDSNSTNVYPISSYTAYATLSTPPNGTPPNCNAGDGFNDNCASVTGGVSGTGNYWRVCLSVTTPRGRIMTSSMSDTANKGSIMAITRCRPGTSTATPPNVEPTGSVFQVYHN